MIPVVLIDLIIEFVPKWEIAEWVKYDSENDNDAMLSNPLAFESGFWKVCEIPAHTYFPYKVLRNPAIADFLKANFDDCDQDAGLLWANPGLTEFLFANRFQVDWDCILTNSHPKAVEYILEHWGNMARLKYANPGCIDQIRQDNQSLPKLPLQVCANPNAMDIIRKFEITANHIAWLVDNPHVEALEMVRTFCRDSTIYYLKLEMICWPIQVFSKTAEEKML